MDLPSPGFPARYGGGRHLQIPGDLVDGHVVSATKDSQLLSAQDFGLVVSDGNMFDMQMSSRPATYPDAERFPENALR